MDAKDFYSHEEVTSLLKELLMECSCSDGVLGGLTPAEGAKWILEKIGNKEDIKKQKRKKYKTPEYRINKMKEMGFSIIFLGKNIEARRGDEVYRGTVAKVHRDIFSY